MKVNHFIIGWPKTGSTSLYHYLEQHPDVMVAKKKDTYFFCDDLRQASFRFHGKHKFNFIDSIERYESLFEDYSNEKIICESSVFYAISETAAKNIHEHNPNSKIVIILRDPKELMMSWYNYQKFHSRETAESFSEAIQLEEKRKKDETLIPRSAYMPLHVYYKSLVEFDKGIRQFQRYFTNDNIKIIFSEDLEKSTLSSVQEVYKFLDIDPSFVPDLEMKNVTFKSKNRKLKSILDTTLRPLKIAFRKAISPKIHQKARSIYRSIFMNTEKAQKSINSNMESELNGFLVPMLERTSELIHLDLIEKWNYK